jgi:hypothetical protein
MSVLDLGEFCGFHERPGSGIPAGRRIQLVRGVSGTLFDPEAAKMGVIVISPDQENRLLIYGNNLPTPRHHVGFEFNCYINQ